MNQEHSLSIKQRTGQCSFLRYLPTMCRFPYFPHPPTFAHTGKVSVNISTSRMMARFNWWKKWEFSLTTFRHEAFRYSALGESVLRVINHLLFPGDLWTMREQCALTAPLKITPESFVTNALKMSLGETITEPSPSFSLSLFLSFSLSPSCLSVLLFLKPTHKSTSKLELLP